MLPAAASGRNGWYVMCGCGSTTMTSASRELSFFDRRRAAYSPTCPAPDDKDPLRIHVIHLSPGGADYRVETPVCDGAQHL